MTALSAYFFLPSLVCGTSDCEDIVSWDTNSTAVFRLLWATAEITDTRWGNSGWEERSENLPYGCFDARVEWKACVSNSADYADACFANVTFEYAPGDIMHGEVLAREVPAGEVKIMEAATWIRFHKLAGVTRILVDVMDEESLIMGSD